MRNIARLLLLLCAILLTACGTEATSTPAATTPTAMAATDPTTATGATTTEVLLATTTSTQDSGLLDVLIPDFKERTGYQIKAVAVGSGQAMKMGEEGNADVLLVHSPDAEKTFMDNGFGVDRRLVMHNDFIVIGPEADPAKISGMGAVPAMQAIAGAEAPFVSRGDNSGTNALELKLWKQASIDPNGKSWYIVSGQGMGATLSIANERNAYTISDRATYLSFTDSITLKVLAEKDPLLLNVYHVIRVNPEKWPQSNIAGATAFADYLVSPEAQKLIGEFGIDKYKQPLFVPDAGKDENNLGG